jgi:Domain of unknown function (DUF1707)
MSDHDDDLRLSDAERETASQALGEHFAQGRLDADEHAERHERIWASRTRGEIPALFADLPGGSPLHPEAAWSAAASPVSWAARRTPPTARPRSARRGLPGPLKVLLLVAAVLLVVAHLPFVLVFLGVAWLVTHRGRSACSSGPRRHYSTG